MKTEKKNLGRGTNGLTHRFKAAAITAPLGPEGLPNKNQKAIYDKKSRSPMGVWLDKAPSRPETEQ